MRKYSFYFDKDYLATMVKDDDQSLDKIIEEHPRGFKLIPANDGCIYHVNMDQVKAIKIEQIQDLPPLSNNNVIIDAEAT